MINWWENEWDWRPAGPGLEIYSRVADYYQVKLRISTEYTLPNWIYTIFERYASYGCCGQRIEATLNTCQCGGSGAEVDGWTYYWILFTEIDLASEWDLYESVREQIKKLEDREKYQRRKERIAETEGHHTEAQIAAVWEMQDGQCYYCGDPLIPRGSKGAYHKDHIIPLSQMGTHWIDNIALACDRCNSLKGALSVKLFKEKLTKIIGSERVESRAGQVLDHYRRKRHLRNQTDNEES
ncbi:hypothetical protein A3197_17195 [Candidatus Thiodiazotropha endoloripes]|nr:hypothetical protein A3197_17195 [Candidatus Thiodiazotropha endoloripes]